MPNQFSNASTIPPNQPDFTSAEFVAFLASPPKFTTGGQLLISLLIEPDSVDDALCLRYLTRNPLPVRCQLTADTAILDDMANHARD